MADTKISALPSATALAGTEVAPVVQGGATKKTTIDQILTPAAGKGVNFSANAPSAGSTSQLLDWYEEGTWTPDQGAGLTIVGAFASSGTYTRVGRQVTLTGVVYGATSVAVSAGGQITSNVPFAAGTSSAGIVCGYITTSTGTVLIGTGIAAMEAIGASTYLMFSTTYSI